MKEADDLIGRNMRMPARNFFRQKSEFRRRVWDAVHNWIVYAPLVVDNAIWGQIETQVEAAVRGETP